VTNPNKENRELSMDELETVSAGGGISIRSFMPSIMTKQASGPNPAETTTPYPKASFDPATIKF
jgi:hypothetical protein